MSENPLLAIMLALFLVPVALAAFLSPVPAGGPVIPAPSAGTAWPSYTVQAGDSVSAIARRTGVPVEYILASNDLDPARLRPGQQLVLPAGGVLHAVKPGQRLADIAQSYGVAESSIRLANDLRGDPTPGMRVLVPAPAVIPQATAISLGKCESARFAWPARGPISSPFGPRIHPVYRVPSFHAGIDLALAEGTPISAAATGRVVTAGWEGGFGLLVVIDHGEGLLTYYGHLSQLRVVTGQFVEIGQIVALSGNTGLSTGPHLHFEVRRDGVAVDPFLFLP